MFFTECVGFLKLKNMRIYLKGLTSKCRFCEILKKQQKKKWKEIDVIGIEEENDPCSTTGKSSF